MNVLSLFDGISCGQIALERAKIKINKYYASEIDKDAIGITQFHYPNTIQLGDIRNINTTNLPKMNLMIGGSPCQSFSFLGSKDGMKTIDNFEVTTFEQYLEYKNKGYIFKGQSYLFWEYVRILKEIKPKYFILENVNMSLKWKEIITKTLNVVPILINSNLVSAQNRRRLYWTNIPNINQPKDKNIYLSSILEKDIKILQKYKLPKTKSRIQMWNGTCKNITNELKSSCVTTKQDGWHNQGLLEFDGFCRFCTPIELERLQTINDNYTLVNNISDKKRDFLVGNAWTIDVITHILSFIEDKDE
jgi:DNA (cytosine-5)-methyltransferase 3A